jgi:hypothetical protein
LRLRRPNLEFAWSRRALACSRRPWIYLIKLAANEEFD